MICKSCGAVIKHNEEYCRKCGSLVINFTQVENKNLKDICIENNARGKLQRFINKITNKETKVREVNYSKHSVGKNKLHHSESSYNNSTKKTSPNNKSSKENYNSNTTIEEIINSIKDSLKL